LPNLTISLPAGVQGEYDVSVGLVSADGTILAEARTKLVVLAPSIQEAPLPPAVAGTVRVPAPEEHERALGLHAKGQEQLERGSIYAARRFFERAAGMGLAQSALALADTYNPDELAKRGVVGIEPDIEAARQWYGKALELGAAEASDRLRRLGSR